MDVLRTFYVAPVRPYANSSDTIPVQWYRCAPGALPFPGSHAFGSLVWDPEYGQQFQGPGEFAPRTTWVPNQNFPCPGIAVPPDLQRFKRGLLPSDGPLPECCGGQWLFGQGGMGGGGGTSTSTIGGGGTKGDGQMVTWNVPCTPHLCSQGGVLIDGTAVFAGQGVYANEGGVMGDAGFPETPQAQVFVASGGVQADSDVY